MLEMSQQNSNHCHFDVLRIIKRRSFARNADERVLVSRNRISSITITSPEHAFCPLSLIGCRLEGKIRRDIVIDLKYSLVIEATEDPTFFGFYSLDLEGFTGIGHSIEDCLYQAKWGMKEHVGLLKEQSLPVPQENPDPKIIIPEPRVCSQGQLNTFRAVNFAHSDVSRILEMWKYHGPRVYG
jgi:predicted RNase H-like HicB family nuclease